MGSKLEEKSLLVPNTATPPYLARPSGVAVGTGTGVFVACGTAVGAAGRGVELTSEGTLVPMAYELDIELPRAGGFGLMASVGIGVAALAGVYIVSWLVLYIFAGDVPLPSGIS